MREKILNTWWLLSIAILFLVFAFLSDESHWFPRAGGVATVLGLLLTIKHNVLSSSRDAHSVVMEKRHYANWAPDADSETYRNDLKLAHRIMRDEYLGLSLTVAGTIVWAYGDLIHRYITALRAVE